ncbi:unnamed protein product [Didymodactylos carnosus]|uniref:F-box domain-containing protein n=1 Tax=Didymodactylos carnosus TaxID=1234261 RepID=A0A815FA96_9BILA|nr:unnamed protein product [Didymodactylos carnosus]CAF1325791.1 unnamed protein product [Didymodactylos carnosus]CAF4001718.1 unnamed protein product [Didymodactylos carnosus]CAF4175444.1 unnamed protein product [Didymodactylos carnosus]
MATLEILSNELFLEIFDYLSPTEIFSTFHNLNSRIDRLLSLQSIRIDLKTVEKPDFMDYCEHFIPTCYDRIKYLQLCNNHKENFISLFCQLFPNMDKFSTLHTLILIKPTVDKLLHLLPQLSTLIRLVIIGKQENKQENEICSLIFNDKMLSLKSCTLSFFNQLHMDGICVSNIEYLKISMLKLETMFHLFHYIPNIKTLNVTISTYDETSVPSPSGYQKLAMLVQNLTNLTLEVSHFSTFEPIELLLKNLVQLQRLSYICSDAIGLEHIDSERWKSILVRLYILKKFHLSIKTHIATTFENILASFQTNVFIHRQWYFAFDEDALSNVIHFYTIPYFSSKYSLKMTTIAARNAHCYTNVKYLVIRLNNSTFLSPPIRFPNVGSLQLFGSCDCSPSVIINYLDIALDYSKLKHFEFYTKISEDLFLHILRHSSNLYSLKTKYSILSKITNDFTHDEMCSYLKKNIKKCVLVKTTHTKISDLCSHVISNEIIEFLSN